MRRTAPKVLLAVLAALAVLGSVPDPAASQSPNAQRPTLYLVGYAHLDT